MSPSALTLCYGEGMPAHCMFVISANAAEIYNMQKFYISIFLIDYHKSLDYPGL